jgi:3-hydroxyisobutyrate dehydrogenase
MVRRADISVSLFMEILRNSALFAPTFDKKLNRMLDRDFTAPNFTTKNLLKDIKLFNQEARALGLNTAMAEGVQSIVETALIEGHSDDDYSAIYTVIDPTGE